MVPTDESWNCFDGVGRKCSRSYWGIGIREVVDVGTETCVSSDGGFCTSDCGDWALDGAVRSWGVIFSGRGGCMNRGSFHTERVYWRIAERGRDLGVIGIVCGICT